MPEQYLFPFRHGRHNYLLFAPEETEIHGITFARSQTVCNWRASTCSLLKLGLLTALPPAGEPWPGMAGMEELVLPVDFLKIL